MEKQTILLKSDNIYLKVLTPKIMSKEYILWLRDPVVNKFLETKGDNLTKESLDKFVVNMLESSHNYLFGIFDLNDKHIGNIKIGNIHHLHKRADIGLVIGEKEFWGRGIASEAIRLVTKFAFNNLGLHKVFAGVHSINSGSLKAFLNNDFIMCAEMKEHSMIDNDFIDVILIEKINNKYS